MLQLQFLVNICSLMCVKSTYTILTCRQVTSNTLNILMFPFTSQTEERRDKIFITFNFLQYSSEINSSGDNVKFRISREDQEIHQSSQIFREESKKLTCSLDRGTRRKAAHLSNVADVHLYSKWSSIRERIVITHLQR